MKEGVGKINNNIISTSSKNELIVRLIANYREVFEKAEQILGVKIYSRGEKVSVTGKDQDVIQKLENLLEQFAELSLIGQKFTNNEIRYALSQLANDGFVNLKSLYDDVICLSNKGKPVRPYTEGQKKYIQAIRENDITFGIGPAGTGKTYLAVAQAVAYLKEAKVNKIVLVRPVVEAGESLGFLPGDMIDKVEPYLRPLYDAFYDLLPIEKFNRYFEKGVIELAPLAYMRGRTLNDSFIILDEAQNTTQEQMKMFLTRLGFGSKAVVTGDITQIDLQSSKESGLKKVQSILNDIQGIAFVNLTSRDVVRHEIVQRIVRAYEEYDIRKKEK